MEALWLIPAIVILVAGWFMVKAFVRLGGAMVEMRDSLAELGEMGPRLQQLGDDMAAFNQAMEKRAGQAEPPPASD